MSSLVTISAKSLDRCRRTIGRAPKGTRWKLGSKNKDYAILEYDETNPRQKEYAKGVLACQFTKKALKTMERRRIAAHKWG
jgi:hypothetical protein